VKGWLGVDSAEGEEVGWGAQNMGSKYKEKFLGWTKKLFWWNNFIILYILS
jgi:hypothetical protein